MMTKCDIGNYQKSCLRMVKEFPYISEMFRKNKYAVPSSPRQINVGYWQDDDIENIARNLKCVNHYSYIYDNNVTIYVPDDYYNYWGSHTIKVSFCCESQYGYLSWYDEQDRKYNKHHFVDNIDLLKQIEIVQECE